MMPELLPTGSRMTAATSLPCGDDALDARHVVGREERRTVRHLLQHARVGRAVEVVVHAERHLIVPAMEVRLEAQDPGLAGRCAGDPQRELRRFRARRGEPHALDRRHHRLDQARPFDFQLVRGREVHALPELRPDRLQDLGVLVAEEQRTVTAVVIDVLVAVDVPFARAERAVAVDAVGRHPP